MNNGSGKPVLVGDVPGLGDHVVRACVQRSCFPIVICSNMPAGSWQETIRCAIDVTSADRAS